MAEVSFLLGRVVYLRVRSDLSRGVRKAEKFLTAGALGVSSSRIEI
jgi:hypothetical protein